MTDTIIFKYIDLRPLNPIPFIIYMNKKTKRVHAKLGKEKYVLTADRFTFLLDTVLRDNPLCILYYNNALITSAKYSGIFT